MRTTRDIIQIDEERCNGCGQCVRDCAEGAIAIIDGKARMISESYCDGLGACLSGCPQGALQIIHREADPFDEQAVEKHLARNTEPLPCGCSGTAVRQFPTHATALFEAAGTRSWPVKLRLVPPTAPFLKGAHLLIAADCAGAASARFHQLAKDKIILIACPKFEDAAAMRERLAELRHVAAPASVTVLRMEVPCCTGLAALCREVFGLGVREVIMGCDGEPKARSPLIKA